MPQCSKAKHPSGTEIEFFEDTHKYVSTIKGRELVYVSGTQFLGRYYPPFDPTGKITECCARREGLTVEEIKRKWADKSARSCRLGTRTHERIEDCLLSNEPRNVPEDPEEEMRFRNGVEMASKLKQRVDVIGVEKIVFSPELGIAGTVDALLKSRKDGTYIILDHKTNQSICGPADNKYGEFCLGPISHLPNTEFWHYAAQLSLYEYLLKREKYVPKDAKFKRMLNHVTAESAKLIDLPDLQLEIRDLVIDFLLGRAPSGVKSLS